MNMKRVSLAVAGIFAIFAAATAQAAVLENGLSVNGLSVNGLSVNGLSVNGANLSGAALAGLKGTAVEVVLPAKAGHSLD